MKLKTTYLVILVFLLIVIVIGSYLFINKTKFEQKEELPSPTSTETQKEPSEIQKESGIDQLKERLKILFYDSFEQYDFKGELYFWKLIKETSIASAFIVEDTQSDGKIGKVLEATFGGIDQDQDYLVAETPELGNFVFQVFARQLDSGYGVPSLIFRYSGDKFYLLELGEKTRLYKVFGKTKTKIGEKQIGIKVDDKNWHKITVMVEDNKIYANIDGELIFDGFVDNEPKMKKGKIGLSGHEYAWKVRYDNVLVLEFNDAAKNFYEKTLLKDNKTTSPYKTITIEDLKAEMKRLEKINTWPENKKINPKDYPVILGEYSENGLILIEKYFCSDICPDNGGVVVVFQDINSKEECAKVGGKDLIDYAWGGYIGCAPKIE